MANTITQRTLRGGGDDRLIIRLINISSDGSEETDLVVYDNSAFINDVSRGTLLKVIGSGSACTCTLEWDQTTDSPSVSFDPSQTQLLDFSQFGGISNPNGTGATGDILLTTTGLDLGDVVTLLLYIKQ